MIALIKMMNYIIGFWNIQKNNKLMSLELDGDEFSINSEVEVTCGTGLFQSNSGQLNMIIKGLLASEENPIPIYELILNGQLEN
jgi:hypothetical protein